MISIIDYKAGNLRSVQKAVEKSGASAIVTSNPADLDRADKIIFPGVGAFGRAVEELERLRFIEPILEQIDRGKPFLGICLGMQLLFETSEENPGSRGLGVLKGFVKRFPENLKVPHLGWNELLFTKSSPLWKNIPTETYFYFAHSYYIQPEDEKVIIGESDYSFRYPVAVNRENLFGLQFHPEKSQKWGLKVLENFISL